MSSSGLAVLWGCAAKFFLVEMTMVGRFVTRVSLALPATVTASPIGIERREKWRMERVIISEITFGLAVALLSGSKIFNQKV